MIRVHQFLLIRIRILNSNKLLLCTRFNSSQVPQQNSKQDHHLSQGDWKHVKQHIPGESIQENKLKDRIPMFPLIKETVPTLLPRPGVPRVGKQHTFSQVVLILRSKRLPELIYESEPHRLYFLACFSFVLMFTVYGVLLAEYAWVKAAQDYNDNVKELSEPLRKREWIFSLLKYGVYSACMFGCAALIIKVPTRLVRRMWYLPGPVEHVKFTLYPLVPGKPTPVITIPLSQLTRRQKLRVWTGKGFYGTADNAMFFFLLRESGLRTRLWFIDRKGFFWLDGRVFDYLFGKELLAEAEAGVPYDEQIGIINREVRRRKHELREKHGIFYRFKWGSEEIKRDVASVEKYVRQLSSGQKLVGINQKRKIPEK